MLATIRTWVSPSTFGAVAVGKAGSFGPVAAAGVTGAAGAGAAGVRSGRRMSGAGAVVSVGAGGDAEPLV
jgi:hypothetical protein